MIIAIISQSITTNVITADVYQNDTFLCDSKSESLKVIIDTLKDSMVRNVEIVGMNSDIAQVMRNNGFIVT